MSNGTMHKSLSSVGFFGRVAVVLAYGLLASGCSKWISLEDDPKAPPSDKSSGPKPILAANSDNDSVGKIYSEAQIQLREKNYEAAAKKFAEVERQHPYSTWARRAILMSAYAQYERNNYDATISASKRFIQLYPGNKDTAYAYYLIGLSYYEQITDVGRDQGVTQKAFDALNEVSRRFPDSKYAENAKKKAVLAKDHLAGKEMEVGRYYLKRHAYIAAVNRFKIVVKDYQTTSHTPEALMRLTEAYLALGIKAEAQTAAAVLGHNYPSSQWYKDSYVLLKSGGLAPRENKQSWISQAWNSVAVF